MTPTGIEEGVRAKQNPLFPRKLRFQHSAGFVVRDVSNHFALGFGICSECGHIVAHAAYALYKERLQALKAIHFNEIDFRIRG